MKWIRADDSDYLLFLLYRMNEKLKYSITINAPKEKVWHTMLDDKTYREWTTEFNPGSYYEGDRKEGSEIRFL